jgi:hypothetical protein
MTNNTSPELTVKERYGQCKQFECPRLLALCETDADGKPYFVEGSVAYAAIVLCNNWALGLSDGECPISSDDIAE